MWVIAGREQYKIPQFPHQQLTVGMLREELTSEREITTAEGETTAQKEQVTLLEQAGVNYRRKHQHPQIQIHWDPCMLKIDHHKHKPTYAIVSRYNLVFD